jgi:hypothetical protein
VAVDLDLNERRLGVTELKAREDCFKRRKV